MMSLKPIVAGLMVIMESLEIEEYFRCLFTTVIFIVIFNLAEQKV